MLSFWPLGAFIMAFGLYLMQKNIFGNKFEYWSHIEMGSSNEKQYEKAFDGGWFLWQMNTPIIPRALCGVYAGVFFEIYMYARNNLKWSIFVPKANPENLVKIWAPEEEI